MATWTSSIELVGAGGEPVDFARTLLSHGVADLPPNEIAPDGTRLTTVLRAGTGAWLIELSAAGPGRARIRAVGPSPRLIGERNWSRRYATCFVSTRI